MTRSLLAVVGMEIQMREVIRIERREGTNQTLTRIDALVAVDPPIEVIVVFMIIVMAVVVVVAVVAEINKVLLAQA